MDINIEDQRSNLRQELKSKLCCRFCLSLQKDKLDSIYMRNTRIKSTAPLTVQIMACTSLEVFSNDDMPSMICFDCRLQFEYSYRFQQMCKRAENLLRQYPLTGHWPNPLMKPIIPQELIVKSQLKIEPQSPGQQQKLQLQKQKPRQQQQQQQHQQQQQSQQQQQQQQYYDDSVVVTTTQTSPSKLLNSSYALKQKPQISEVIHIVKRPTTKIAGQKFLLNANPAESPEPPVPKRLKKEKYDMNDEATIVLNKVENNEELSMDDVHRLIAATENSEEFMDMPRSTPKLLNKSSKRILNKEVNIKFEPRLSTPMITHTEDGHVEIVTEILDENTPYEPETDLIKNAVPVQTNVFPCPHCDRSFPLLQLREIHMVNHNRERSFQCNHCDKSFFSKYDLQKHVVTHSEDRPFKCSVCNRGFTRSTLLHRHERTHTDIPKFICVYCEKEFISKNEMEKHAERHKKNRPFKCKICDKAFAFKQGLERHEVIHLRDQPYPCRYCDLSFATPNKLARHLTAHAGKRPYPCKICSKSYLLSHHLTRHLRSHRQTSGSFKCNNCKKVCNSRDELIKHSNTHALVERSCGLCKATFKNVNDIMSHIQQHADVDDNFACEFCDCIFFSSEFLQNHIDTSHADEMAAYHEDDKAQQQKSNKDSNNTKPNTSAKKGAENGSFEEFYVEANIFDENAEFLTEKDENAVDILDTEELELEEIEDYGQISEGDRELDAKEDVVEVDAEEVVEEEVYLDEDEEEEEEEEEEQEEHEVVEIKPSVVKIKKLRQSDLDESTPAKIQKIINYNKKTTAKTTSPTKGGSIVEVQKTTASKQKLTPETAKLPIVKQKLSSGPAKVQQALKNETTTTQKQQAQKFEKKIIIQNQAVKQKFDNKMPLINSVLSSLPKGITARKTTPGSRTGTETIATKQNANNEKKSIEKTSVVQNRAAQKSTTTTTTLSQETKSPRSAEKATTKENAGTKSTGKTVTGGAGAATKPKAGTMRKAGRPPKRY